MRDARSLAIAPQERHPIPAPQILESKALVCATDPASNSRRSQPSLPIPAFPFTELKNIPISLRPLDIRPISAPRKFVLALSRATF
jgi:hypothetical protein